MAGEHETRYYHRHRGGRCRLGRHRGARRRAAVVVSTPHHADDLRGVASSLSFVESCRWIDVYPWRVVVVMMKKMVVAAVRLQLPRY